jgi:hypothetical protein
MLNLVVHIVTTGPQRVKQIISALKYHQQLQMTPVQCTSQPDISSAADKVAVSSGNNQTEARGSHPALYNYHVTFRTSSSSDQTVHPDYIQFTAIYAHFYLVTLASANGVLHITHLQTANNKQGHYVALA